jgi:hypothetical protein
MGFECGLVKINDPIKVSFGLNLIEILEQRKRYDKPGFTHIALLEDQFETNGERITKKNN